ncbi:AI-2E family transporter [Salsipaludibacter albus]|uniref:AI-2E family transporter n=1 Tax=Salsipaludibacter albus TaxID=2849650 RepID=UPI001EE4035D|nr:AI-2E family transporter [Salsipaludibacter albus]MBY5163433.1 AI-2E family transporter [Salsipaludibacter albus]
MDLPPDASTEAAPDRDRDDPSTVADPDGPRGQRWADADNSMVAQPPAWLRLAAGWGWRLGILGVVTWVVLRFMAQLLVVTLPLIIAIVLTTLCWPLRERLVRRGVPPALSAAIVVIGGLVVLVGLFAAIGPGFVDQIGELGETIQDGSDAVIAWLEDSPFGIEVDLGQVLDQVRSAMLSGGGGGSQVVGSIVSGLSVAGQFLAGLALTVVLLFFIVKDGDVMVAWVRGLLSSNHRPTASAIGQRAWSALSGYVRGTAAIAAIDALGIGLGLLLLGVPLVLPLMLLVFFGGFLPVIGAFIAGLVAVLVALADGGIVTALLALAVVIGVQQVEGNVLQPIIMRRAVALHPIVVLVALGAGAAIAGIIGAFISVPIAAVLAAVGNELRLRGRAGLLTAATAGAAPSAPLGGPGGSLDTEVEDPEEAAADPAAREDLPGDITPGHDDT